MKNANKPFTYYMGFVVIFGIIAGLCIKLKYMGAGGIFTSITSALLILGLAWGFYPDPLNVRKRSVVRLGMFALLFHLFVFSVIGTSQATVGALNIDNATKSIETISKTYSTLENIKNIGWSILKFDSVSFKNILWVYFIPFIGFCIPLYKLLRSWGWSSLFASGATIGFLICTIKFWVPLGIKWHWAGLFLVLICGMLSMYFGKKHLHIPAVV